MVEAIETIQTKLDKVKSFIDNGSFVFMYEKTKPFVIHEDQLFKNQLRNETRDEYDKPVNIPYLSDELKRERIVKIGGVLDKQYGILFDSGRLVIPIWHCAPYNNTGTYPNNHKYGYYALECEDTTDTIRDFTIINGCVYIITMRNNMYRVDTTKTDTNSAVKIQKDSDENVLSGTIVLNDTYKIHIVHKEQANLKETRTTLKIFSNDTKVYVLLVGNVLYSFTHTEDMPAENQYEIEYFDESLKKLKDIKYYENKTYFIFNNGVVKCIGDSSTGIGNGANKGVLTKLTPVGSDMNDTLNGDEKLYLAHRKIKDVAIGKNHTLFLLDDGTCVGFGSNEHYQLGDPDSNKKFIDVYNHIEFKGEVITDIKCTKYGSVFLTMSGRLLYCGTFINGELGVYTKNHPIYAIKPNGEVDFDTLIKDSETLSLSGENPTTKFLRAQKITRIANHFEYVQGQKKLVPTFICGLVNIPSDSGVLIYKEDRRCYYTGKDNKIVGVSTTDTIDIWTPIESNLKYLNRVVTKRDFMWNYYENYIMKLVNTRYNNITNIFYKNHNGIWIDWINFFNEYIKYETLELNGKRLPKTYVIKEYDEVKRQYPNFKSFGLLADKPDVVQRYRVNRKLIPECDYIDKDLKVWSINSGDNIYLRTYTKEDYIRDTKEHDERIELSNMMIEKYEEALAKTSDPTRIEEIRSKIDVEKEVQKKLNASKKHIHDRIGKIDFQERLKFPDSIVYEPLKPIGTEQKTITYTHSVIEEAEYDAAGLILKPHRIKIKEVGGAQTVEKESVDIDVEAFKPKITHEFVDLHYVIDPVHNTDVEMNRNDLKLTINDEVNEKDPKDFDSFLVWINGGFITKDFYEDPNNHKSFISHRALSKIDVRRICEHPGLGEPSSASDKLPKLSVTNATVQEQTSPTEFRYNFDTRVFGWEGIKIEGPYPLYDTLNATENDTSFKTNLDGRITFYYGDAFVEFFTEIRFLDRKIEKGNFMLFMDGAVVPEHEYEVYERDGYSYIKLLSFYDFVVGTLTHMIDRNEPGYIGFVKQFIDEYRELKQFSIAFFHTDEKYKKVKLYYDRQTIRNYPKPDHVMFRDIKYNDLILFDGWFIPYLWESYHCIRIPHSIRSYYSSQNDFLNYADICRVRPYITHKDEHQMTDKEIESYSLDHNLVVASQIPNMSSYELRKLVKDDLALNELQ